MFTLERGPCHGDANCDCDGLTCAASYYRSKSNEDDDAAVAGLTYHSTYGTSLFRFSASYGFVSR